MTVFSIEAVRALLVVIDPQVLFPPLSAQEQDELIAERALQGRLRERQQDDTRRAAQLAADLRELDEVKEQDLQNHNAERGAYFDIVV